MSTNQSKLVKKCIGQSAGKTCAIWLHVHSCHHRVFYQHGEPTRQILTFTPLYTDYLYRLQRIFPRMCVASNSISIACMRHNITQSFTTSTMHTLVYAAVASASILIFPPVPHASPQAAVTKASFTVRQANTSIPLAFNCS